MSDAAQHSGPSRRSLLKAAGVAGAAAGAAALGGCKPAIDPYALPKPDVPGGQGQPRGKEKWVNTTCGQCPAGCGVRVRVVEGRALRIEGNEEFPVNHGSVGPKGQSGIELLYHPDRVRSPLKRTGPRGSGQFEPVTWDAAIADIAKQLGEFRAAGESRGLVLVDGDSRGPMHELWQRFCAAYGTPNCFTHLGTVDEAGALAMEYMHGVHDLPAYDWERTRYVLGFGGSLLESTCQTIHLARASSILRNTPGLRVKFVSVSSRFSVTASRADEWVAIAPATYGALALGLAHVLIRDELYDADFVQNQTFGFESWTDGAGTKHRGFKDVVLEGYAPEQVAAITGVRAETITRIAQELVRHQPAVAIIDGAALGATNALGTAMAVHALNALLGRIGRPGGMLRQHQAPLKPWPDLEADAAGAAGVAAPRIDVANGTAALLGRGNIHDLPAALLDAKVYGAKALFLHKSNPVFSKPDAARWIQTLQAVPLVVSFSPLTDESTFWADYVLPDHTYLERWEIVEPAPSTGSPVVGFRDAVVDPVYDTLASGDVVVRLAKALGGAVAEAFPYDTYQDALEARLKGLLKQKGSSINTKKASSLRKGMAKAGGWWRELDVAAEGATFTTPSGKFEFYSQTIARRLAEAVPDAAALATRLAAKGVKTPPDECCMPHWEPARFEGAPGDYPLVLEVYRGIEHAQGGARHLSWLRELPRRGLRAWYEWVEVSPTDATALGLRTGDVVQVESPAGKRTLEVRVAPAVRPGTAAIPLGHGPWPPTPPAPGATASVSDLLVNISGALSGILALQGTRVRLRKGTA